MAIKAALTECYIKHIFLFFQKSAKWAVKNGICTCKDSQGKMGYIIVRAI
jgi:hypothetical protein